MAPAATGIGAGNLAGAQFFGIGTAPAGFGAAAGGGLNLLELAKIGVAGAQIGGALRQGDEAERLAEERAAIDRANAVATRRSSVERARILTEQGRRLRARQVSAAISGGIRSNVGVPLLIEAQTRADIAQDIGFSLETGRVTSARFRSSADVEERIGKFKKRRSRFDAIGVGAQLGLSFLS